MTENNYIGQELELFAHAQNWKQYFHSRIGPYMEKNVLEVGAGMGETTRVLCDGLQSRWVCLEPDIIFSARIEEMVKNGELPACCRSFCGVVNDLPASESFDTILYIDVLEHIEEDARELASAARHLSTGGHLIVLSPAFQFLYSSFDQQIGHYRRYNAARFRQITPPECSLIRSMYLDAVGTLTSIANRIFLRQSLPTLQQIQFWDQNLVPLSRMLLDPLLGYRVGRSIIGIWVRSCIPPVGR